ncbi:MAG: hypothetical protein K0S39_5802, partial [Paenibacillus sp.]|nr:hypothetical protein [Paenibacillus sp.]
LLKKYRPAHEAIGQHLQTAKKALMHNFCIKSPFTIVPEGYCVKVESKRLALPAEVVIFS